LKNILWLLKKQSIVTPIKQIVGGKVKFCHHSDVHLNIASGWHKDNEGYGALDAWSIGVSGETYGVYKVALYLQDHVGQNPEDFALKVRRASHLSRSLNEGGIEDIYTRAGDAIIFDCRITHMGQHDLLQQHLIGRYFAKPILRLAPSEKSRYRIQQLYRRLMGIADRVAIFYVYGKCNAFTDEHIEGNIRRQNQQNRSAHSSACTEVIANLISVGVGY